MLRAPAGRHRRRRRHGRALFALPRRTPRRRARRGRRSAGGDAGHRRRRIQRRRSAPTSHSRRPTPGASGILAFPPYYPGAEDEGLLQYYQEHRERDRARPAHLQPRLVSSVGGCSSSGWRSIPDADRLEGRPGRHPAPADSPGAGRRPPALDRRRRRRPRAGVLRHRHPRVHVERRQRRRRRSRAASRHRVARRRRRARRR